jgi:hypothetical protein
MDLNKDRLWTAYDEAVTKINAKRNGLLNGPLYRQMQRLVFDTAYVALADTVSAPAQPRMHVLSALPGTGKSTFSNAWAAAIVARGGSVLFVVEQMETADQRYRDLTEILPGQVAVWTTDHRKGNRSPTKVKNPAAQFHKNELKDYPIAICTHEGFKRDEAHLFRNWQAKRAGGSGTTERRTFIVIDEMVKEVTQYTVSIEAIARAVALTQQDESSPPEAIAALDTLHSFLVDRAQKREPIDTLSGQAVRELVATIAWFTSAEAERYAEGREGLTAVFGFARCLSRGWAFITTDGGVTTLTGYDNNLPIEHGTMQLDGTAKLCGYEQLSLPDRVILPGPVVSFGGLRAVIEKPPTKQHLAKYLTKADNLLTYRNWMIEVITRHSKRGQKVLVVCKKALIDMKAFPAWDHNNPNWRRINYQTEFGYELPLSSNGEDGSGSCAPVVHVSVQWWGGPSTGHNAWQEADAVFLFDANWAPRHKVLADMAGLYRVPANSPNGPIAEMGSLRKQSDRFRDYKLRCMMAAHVQAACRGNLRRWDHIALFRRKGDDGSQHPTLILPQCGEQLLVCGLDDDAWLWENWAEMFPGAPLPISTGPRRTTVPKGYKKDWAGLLLELLSQPGLPATVTTRWIGEQLGRKWGDIRKPALAALTALEAAGWRYRPGRGSAPGVFERDTGWSLTNALKTALSA